jgi:hypothetical protein
MLMKKLFAVTAFIIVAVTSFAIIDGSIPPAIVSKSLVFPVSGKKSAIGSFWGDVRDGGQRKHEGIDIFARKGTPVLAVTSGIIVSKATTPRGGKVVWLQSSTHTFQAYYAHLDEQYVRAGQWVQKGEVIGTVGNTGNARTTPAHLHFGIYTWSGAVNPLPYVRHASKISLPADVSKKDFRTKKQGSEIKKKMSAGGRTVFPQQYIARTILIPADPEAQYFVTTRSHVVRTYGGKVQVVGTWRKSGGKYPFRIDLGNKKPLYVDASGKLVTDSGKQVGTVS